MHRSKNYNDICGISYHINRQKENAYVGTGGINNSITQYSTFNTCEPNSKPKERKVSISGIACNIPNKITG